VENRRTGRPAPITVNSSVRTCGSSAWWWPPGGPAATAIGTRLWSWWLSPRLASCAICNGRSKAGHRPAKRLQGEERLAECPSDAGGRDTRAATCSANRAVLTRLYDLAGRADDAQGLPCAIRSDRGSRQDAIPIHPHMLRHGCGYALANAGHETRALQAWLGHKNIQHTARLHRVGSL